MDFITKLLLVAEKNVILVVYNKLSKIAYFMTTIEEMTAEKLVRLFRDNVWKLHGLSKSVISDKGPQFAMELTKDLNKMLKIKMRLLMAFHPQMDGQMEQMNQELEQYLYFFTEYRQRDWPEWLAMVEFTVNNKVHTAIKVLSFIANYERKLQMGADIRRKGKVEKMIEFIERMRRIQEEAEAALKKAQEEMRRQADRGRQKVEEWKKREKVILSTKDLVFKERPAKKLMEKYVGSYKIEEIVLKNMVKLKLLASMRIHPVVNVSRVVRYKEPVKGQRVEELKPAEVKGVK